MYTRPPAPLSHHPARYASGAPVPWNTSPIKGLTTKNLVPRKRDPLFKSHSLNTTPFYQHHSRNLADAQASRHARTPAHTTLPVRDLRPPSRSFAFVLPQHFSPSIPNSNARMHLNRWCRSRRRRRIRTQLCNSAPVPKNSSRQGQGSGLARAHFPAGSSSRSFLMPLTVSHLLAHS